MISKTPPNVNVSMLKVQAAASLIVATERIVNRCAVELLECVMCMCVGENESLISFTLFSFPPAPPPPHSRPQCDPSTCPCGPGCTNLLFKTRLRDGKEVMPSAKSLKLGVFNTQKKGWVRFFNFKERFLSCMKRNSVCSLCSSTLHVGNVHVLYRHAKCLNTDAHKRARAHTHTHTRTRKIQNRR